MNFTKNIFLLFMFIICPLMVFGQMIENFIFIPEGDEFIITGTKYKVTKYESSKIPSSKENSFFTSIFTVDEIGNITEHIHFAYKPRSEIRTLVKDVYIYDENDRVQSWSRLAPKKRMNFKKKPKKKDKILKAVQAVNWIKEVQRGDYEYDSLGIMVKMISKINNQIDTFPYLTRHIIEPGKKIALRYGTDENKRQILIDSIVIIDDSIFHFKPDRFPSFSGRKIENPYLFKKRIYDHRRKRYLTKSFFSYEGVTRLEYNNKGFPVYVYCKETNLSGRIFYDKNGFFIKRSIFKKGDLVRDILCEYEVE